MPEDGDDQTFVVQEKKDDVFDQLEAIRKLTEEASDSEDGQV